MTMEAQDRIRWRTLPLVALNLVVPLLCYHRTVSVKTADFASNENKLQIYAL
jgi:hypothetical protein